MNKRTLIAVPAHEMIHARFAESLMNLDKPAGTGFAMITNTLIYTARNLIAYEAVKAGFDQVLWLDSDMIIPSDALIRLSDDMNDGRELVSALYFTRKDPFVPCIHSDITWEVKSDGWVNTSGDIYKEYPRDQVFEIAGCGFGCVMTSTGLLKRMIDKYGAPFFPLMGMGEDTAFCFRVKQDNIKMFCDARVKAGHIGSKVYDENGYILSEMARRQYEKAKNKIRPVKPE